MGTLIKRYKRFLADIHSVDGEMITIHCPNTGKMTNCAEPDFTVYYSHSNNPKRKYSHTWELAQDNDGNFIGINSAKANLLIKEAIEQDRIPSLIQYEHLQTEVKYGNENSRIDILLTGPDKPNCYVEVKSVTLLDERFGKGRGFFPDTVSIRGRKHLRELIEMKRGGHRAVLIFCVQHSGISSVSIAEHIDPEYMEGIKSALCAGVEVVAYACEMSVTQNYLTLPINVCVEGLSKC
jgi:sugar fermentation stimulation protein A